MKKTKIELAALIVNNGFSIVDFCYGNSALAIRMEKMTRDQLIKYLARYNRETLEDILGEMQEK